MDLVTHIDKHLRTQVIQCVHTSFFSTALTDVQKCHLATTGCSENWDFVNFFKLSYCYMPGQWMLTIPISFFIIFLIFRFISSVVEEFLAPAITYISEWLKLPEALAAVTLLALANGAGDVITALVASGSPGGLSYNIGSIYGAGFFVCSIVVAMTIFSSPNDIQLEANSIWRDVGFYILSTLVIIVFGVIGELTTMSAITMLACYCLLVVIVYIQEKNKPEEKEEEKEEQSKPEEDKKNMQIDKSQRLAEKDLVVFVDDKTDEEKKAESKKWKQTLSKMNTASAAKKMKLLTQKFKAVIYLAMKNKIKQESKETEFEDRGILDKISYIIDLPFLYARKVTLPPCEEENYEKFWAVVFPVPGLLFFLYAATMNPQVWWLATVPVGLLMSIGIYCTSPENEPPKYYILLELFGAVGALMWTYLISGILIDLLNYLGMLSQLDNTYLGLTVIAVGNALPDAVTTIALAKQGYAMMGLTGAYAGQLFGLLIGFGSALLKKTMKEGPQPFDIFVVADLQTNLMNIGVIMVSLLNLVITFVYGLVFKYKFKRSLGTMIGILYVLFVIWATGIAIYNIMH